MIMVILSLKRCLGLCRHGRNRVGDGSAFRYLPRGTNTRGTGSAVGCGVLWQCRFARFLPLPLDSTMNMVPYPAIHVTMRVLRSTGVQGRVEAEGVWNGLRFNPEDIEGGRWLAFPSPSTCFSNLPLCAVLNGVFYHPVTLSSVLRPVRSPLRCLHVLS